MAPAEFLNTLIPRNVVAQTELAYQRRSSHTQRRWRHRLGRVTIIAVLLVSMILLWGEVAGALLQRDAGPIGDRLGIIAWAAAVYVLVFHFTTMLRTLGLAANSLARERQNNTWEMLVLTGIDAREIVYGKWSATVRNQWRQYVLLGVLRAGMAVWLGAYSSREILNLLLGGYIYGSYYSDIQVVLPSPLKILVGAALVFVLTLASLPFTAACGVLASAQVKRSALALGRAMGIRILLLLTFALGSVLAMGAFRLWQFSLLNEVFGRTISALLVNGATFGSELSGVQYRVFPINLYDGLPPDGTIYAIAAAIVSAVLYGLLTVFLLQLAQRRVIREQALPPLPTSKPASTTLT